MCLTELVPWFCLLLTLSIGRADWSRSSLVETNLEWPFQIESFHMVAKHWMMVSTWTGMPFVILGKEQA